MQGTERNVFLRNVANVVSILGVLPLCVLFCEYGYQYLIPLIVYNNIMDDLDGVLAVKLDIKSEFGAMLDNVCDAISHSVFVFVRWDALFSASGQSVCGKCLRSRQFAGNGCDHPALCDSTGPRCMVR